VTRRRRAPALASRTMTAVLGLALLGALGACTTSGHPSAKATGSSPVPSTSAVSSEASSTAAASTPPPTSSLPASVPPASSTPAKVTSAAAPRSTCTTVTVRVIRGSASLGQEVAALQFTNEGTTSCVLVGFPTVTLLRKGQQLGNPSQPSAPTSTSKRTLAPGDTAESLLHDYTQTCNAALSDSVRVQVPGSSTTAIRPGELRGCILRVDKLGPPQ
jgi:hypothetical protein